MANLKCSLNNVRGSTDDVLVMLCRTEAKVEQAVENPVEA